MLSANLQPFLFSSGFNVLNSHNSADVSFSCWIYGVSKSIIWSNVELFYISMTINDITRQASMRYIYKDDDAIKWKPFPCYWPFVRGIHRSPVDSPHKGQWRGALMFFLICAWTNSWATIETPSRSLWRHCNRYSLRTSRTKLFHGNILKDLQQIWNIFYA